MMLILITLTLLVHNSLSYSLYDDDIDDYHLWARSRSGPSSPERTGSSASIDAECKKDILVLWDNSQSIGQGPFKDSVVPFLVNLIKSPKLNVGKEGTQLGFITFSSDERTYMLSDIGQITSADELVTWLKSLQYPALMGEWTYTGKAFDLANETFNVRSPFNVRPEIADVILLFTDGEPRARKRKWVEEQKQLADNCSNSLKNEKDVKIIGLAVGTPTVVNNFLPYIRRWSSEGSVFNAKVDELDNVISKLVADTCENAGECICTKPLSPFIVYAGPGQQSVTVSWPMPQAEKEDGATCGQSSIDPPDAAPGGKYSVGKHVINYLFSNGAENPTIANCPVKFEVVPCSCPPTQLVTGKVKDGKKTVEVNWQEPQPNCPTVPSQVNPATSGSFSVGKYTRTYKYTYRQPGRNSFQLECHVKISITGELCDDTAFDPTGKECCCGNIYKKKPRHACCGKNYHDTQTEDCCSEQRAIVRPNGKCP